MQAVPRATWFNTEVQPTTYNYGTPTPDKTNDTSQNLNNTINGASPSLDWIDQALQSAQSTDSSQYWHDDVLKDPKAMSGDPSAIQYWIGRINQGDGALAVRQGLVQKFNDSGSSSGQGQNGLGGISDASLDSLNKTLQDFMKQQNTPQNVTWTGSQKSKPAYGGFTNPSMNGYGNMSSSMMGNNSGMSSPYTSGLKSLGYGG